MKPHVSKVILLLLRFTPRFVRTMFLVTILIPMVACTFTQPPRQVEAVTPTPEIFNALNPSPTSSNSALPMTCQVTDLNVYVSEAWDYCLAYPLNYERDESRAAEGIVNFYGTALEDNADPIRVSLEITTQPVSKGGSLARLVDAYLTSFQTVTMPMPIRREPWRLGNEPAEKLEPVPGLLSSRVVMALHEDILFTLRFHPSDLDFAKPDLDALTQTVTGSFAFLSGNAAQGSHQKTISWHEFGQEISLSYEATLAPWVDAQTVPAIPVNDQILFAEAHPMYVQIRFLGFQGGKPYDLPLLPLENRVARVMVFQTKDFPGYGDASPEGFVDQKQALADLLKTGVNPARCAQPLISAPGLPFLPWINMKQSFCAQPQILAFSGGKGIRYLSHYSQAPEPVLEGQVFYTFQGMTGDGEFYISALFPIQTGVFATQAPVCIQCGDPNYNPLLEWTALLATQLTQLNEQAADRFIPSLDVLDQLIQSIQIWQSPS